MNKLNLLSIDTSTDNLSISVMKKGEIAVNKNRIKKYGASDAVRFIENSLIKAEIKLPQLDSFVIGLGPGSFTGLRIAVSAVKGLSMALNIPVIGISSFYSCVNQLPEKLKRAVVVSDAKRNLVYAAGFKKNKFLWRKEKKENLYKLEDVIDKYSGYTFITYDENIFSQLKSVQSLELFNSLILPKAKSLFPNALKWYDDKKFTDLKKLEPIYVYPKDCQIRKI